MGTWVTAFLLPLGGEGQDEGELPSHPHQARKEPLKTGEGARGTLRDLAGIVASRIPAQCTEPEAFRFFPTNNRVAKSERYIPKNFLGHPYFKAGYRVDYKGGQGSYQLILVPHGSPTEAEQAFTKYREHLAPHNTSLNSDKRGEYRTMSTTNGKIIFLYRSFMGRSIGRNRRDRCLQAARGNDQGHQETALGPVLGRNGNGPNRRQLRERGDPGGAWGTGATPAPMPL